VIGFLVRLYPAPWRTRYGDEYRALLEERVLGPFDVADVLIGAVDAHLHLRGLRASPSQPRGLSMSIRIGGLAAMATGAFWLLAALGLTGLLGDLPALSGIVFGGASATSLVALVGLSAFQARRHPALIWAAIAIPALGSLISIAGMIGMAVIGDRSVLGDLTPWAIWSIGLFGIVGGSVIFAVVTWATNVLSRPAAATLAAGGLVVFALMLGGYSGAIQVDAAIILGPALLLFCAGWFGLGFMALRATRPGEAGASA
jgi:hypothetical protein